MKRTVALIGCLAFLSIGALACDRDQDSTPRIDMQKRAEPVAPATAPSATPVRVAVGGMITPREGFAYYRKFLDYLSEKLGRPVDFVDRDDYEEINRLIRNGEVDVAFVCGGPYVSGHRDFGMELLAAPVAYGAPVYYSYIIVPRDSTARSFADLRGKRFAFTDPLSNSGKLVPTYMLAKMGETPEGFFSKVVYSKSHDRSIKAVADELVDGASVDSLIWEYANSRDPVDTARTRIIVKSPPYGIPPVVAGPHIDPRLKQQVRDIFLNAHRDAQGRQILQGMMIERFVLIKDSAYDSIREMNRWIEGRKGTH